MYLLSPFAASVQTPRVASSLGTPKRLSLTFEHVYCIVFMEKVGVYPRAGGRFHRVTVGKDWKMFLGIGFMFPFCFSYDALRRSKTRLRRSKTLLRRILSCFKTRFDALRRHR